MSEDLWDFYSYDSASDDELLAIEYERLNAEEAAIHVITPGRRTRRLAAGPFVLSGQQFYPDEDPGRDSANDDDAELDVETLLERQHYAFPDEPDDEARSAHP